MNVTAGANMHDLHGWTEVDCHTADEARGAQPVSPGSSLTDLDGEHGDAVMYTEWWNEIGQPVLRDYLWSPLDDDRNCVHYVPEVPA